MRLINNDPIIQLRNNNLKAQYKYSLKGGGGGGGGGKFIDAHLTNS